MEKKSITTWKKHNTTQKHIEIRLKKIIDKKYNAQSTPRDFL